MQSCPRHDGFMCQIWAEETILQEKHDGPATHGYLCTRSRPVHLSNRLEKKIILTFLTEHFSFNILV
ncbi:hypothetical protein DPMN_043215 [Dreissena polymorpha]|uniref:Uncharacterized protein n=1 Tax=Dreissena polymorpha TaxID=45954 RepID=A0A9D4HXR0_DREPO|nr:hypothetical protein DPMN_043215 [Dreissena polymorpha]